MKSLDSENCPICWPERKSFALADASYLLNKLETNHKQLWHQRGISNRGEWVAEDSWRCAEYIQQPKVQEINYSLSKNLKFLCVHLSENPDSTSKKTWKPCMEEIASK